jgi:signal peptidase
MRSSLAVKPEPVVKVAPVVVETPKKAKNPVLSSIGTGLSVGFLLLVLAAGMLLIAIPKLTGGIPLTILTQSMEPLLPPGTLVVDRPVKPSQIDIGDIVTYQIAPGEPEVITHRVVAITYGSNGARTFTFKGDNNALPDAPVLPAQIKGRLFYSIPGIGVVSLWMNGTARSWIVPFAAGALFLFATWMFIAGVVERARKRKRSQNHTLAA